jgi:hypothetical protein
MCSFTTGSNDVLADGIACVCHRIMTRRRERRQNTSCERAMNVVVTLPPIPTNTRCATFRTGFLAFQTLNTFAFVAFFN